MADIIKTIAPSGADHATIQAWWDARTGGVGDVYRGVLTAAVDYQGSSNLINGLTGSYSGAVELIADPSVAVNLESPSIAHAKITNATTTVAALHWPTSVPITVEGIEIATPSITLAAFRFGASVDANVTIKKCLLRGGVNNAAHTRAGSITTILDSLLIDARENAVANNVTGLTIRRSTIIRANQGNVNFRGGIRHDVAGTIIDNVVSYGCLQADFYGGTTVNATVSYASSGDSTARGSSALTGVTTADFADYANENFTAAASGVLDGTGPSGADRGLSVGGVASISISSPAEWSVSPRNPATNTGSLNITGSYANATPASIEARFAGGSWAVIDAAPTGGTFSGTLTGQPAVNGLLEVRMSDAAAVTSSVSNIAIGAKFLFWGQSNFSGRADNEQPYTATSGWFHKLTVSTPSWVEGADPFDDDTAFTTSGSLFPRLASLLTAELNCPVGFVGVAEGSTTLSAWQPAQSINARMLSYITASGGDFEVVVSWIGESDALNNTAEATVKSGYNTVIDQLYTLTGVKSLLVAPAGEDTTAYSNIRQWISDIAADNVNAYADEVQMWPLFQKVHYETDAETNLAAGAIFDSISATYIAPVVSSVSLSMPNFSVSAVASMEYATSASSILFAMPQMSLSAEVVSSLPAFPAEIASVMPQFVINATSDNSAPLRNALVSINMPQFMVMAYTGGITRYSSVGTHLEFASLSTHLDYTIQ